LETIVFGWVPPDGVASNSVRTTERELVTTTTTDRVTFFRGFAAGAAAGGALAAGALAAGAGTGAAVCAEAALVINAAQTTDATKAKD